MEKQNDTSPGGDGGSPMSERRVVNGGTPWKVSLATYRGQWKIFDCQGWPILQVKDREIADLLVKHANAYGTVDDLQDPKEENLEELLAWCSKEELLIYPCQNGRFEIVNFQTIPWGSGGTIQEALLSAKRALEGGK